MVLGSTGNVYEVEIGPSPCCDCPDFLRRQSPCKHVLFVYLRVLRLDSDDPRIWQKRLRAPDLADILQNRQVQRLEAGVAAPRAVKRRYDEVLGVSTAEEKLE